MKGLSLSLLLILSALNAARGEVSVTIYNQDLALVRETRSLKFTPGVGEVRFTDVAKRIIPTSVHFESERAVLLEQNYEYDLVDAEKLLGKFIDQEIQITTRRDKRFRGQLLSAAGSDIVIRSNGSICTVARDEITNIDFPKLPEGLITRPTLVWLVDCDQGGAGDADISYLTHGVSWSAEYVAVTDQDDKSLEMTGWVNIDNCSGATWRDARIKLMAGDVRVIKPRRDRGIAVPTAEVAIYRKAAAQFAEQPFYEYHLYTLQRPSTLRDNQVKQISLFPTAHVKSVEKEYRYDWHKQRGKRSKRNKVNVTLVYKNSSDNGLGIPLPKGKVRVYKQGPDGGLEFIGEDLIDHTPRDETLRIATGDAFDIVGERSEIDVTRAGRQRKIEIKVRNHKDKPVEVVVAEHLFGDWEMLEATEGWEKKRADLVEWTVELAPSEEKTITYTVRYQY